MSKKKDKYRVEVGKRMQQVREMLQLTRPEMADQLLINRTGYFKNEAGYNFPGPFTLGQLQRKFDVSMDWLMFNKGPVFYKDKKQGKDALPLEEKLPELKEMLVMLEQDGQLKTELLACFYRYKSKLPPANGF